MIARTLSAALCLAAMTLPAVAAPAYLDDRSTAQTVVSSFYNAIDRQEYARAWSYYEDGQGVPKFKAFAAGYQGTKSVAVVFGATSEDGAAGSTYYTVPVSIDALDGAGKHSYFAGCYTLRLANPAIQSDPPFRPLHIFDGHLKKATGAGKGFVPASCTP